MRYSYTITLMYPITLAKRVLLPRRCLLRHVLVNSFATNDPAFIVCAALHVLWRELLLPTIDTRARTVRHGVKIG